MIESTDRVLASPPGLMRRPIDWRRLEAHLADIGALHTLVYRTLRDLIPAGVLSFYWFWKHPGVFFQGGAWWFSPHISVVEIAMLIGVTLAFRMVAASQSRSSHQLIHKEISANLGAAFLSSLLIFPALFLRLGAVQGLRVACGFLAATSVLNLALLGSACLVGWFSFSALIARREVLIVGSGPAAQAVFDDLMDSPIYHVTGILDDDFHGASPADGTDDDTAQADNLLMRERYLGPLDRLDSLLREHPISIVFCALPVKSMYVPIQSVIEVCERFGVELRHPSNLFQTSIAQLDRRVDGRRSYSILRMVRHDSTLYLKRAFDIAAASALLILTLPIMGAAAVAIKLGSKGPVFFLQTRYGMHRKKFRIYKMRTMVTDAEAQIHALEAMNETDGAAFKMKFDPRITRVGAFLRKSSIDELPQLWNVVRGEMSLVGPRPLAVRDVLRIQNSAQLRRFSVKPGITCIWQMSGRHNPSFDNWIRQDLEYIDSWTLGLDLRILLGTIPAVLRGHGAS